MAINNSRSMNDQMQRGMLDGSVKNMRPDAAAADYSSVLERARQLHPMNYGTFGSGSDNMTPFMEDFLPDSSLRDRRRESGARGY